MMKNDLSRIAASHTPVLKSASVSGNVGVIRQVFPSGMETIFAIKFPQHGKKYQLKPCLQELKTLKLPQKVIAFFSGMSQSYVSKLSK